MEKIQHRTLSVNGINMHIAELFPTTDNNSKPPILLLHGFPEFWYTWRYQLPALSSAGYRAIAPDLRGFGDTDAPPSVNSYTVFHVVGDLVALLDQLGLGEVFVVGHDWGAIMGWYLALIRPDKVKAMVNLSVAYNPRNPRYKPVDGLRMAFGDDFYICRFQDPGMEEELASIELERWLKKVITSRDPKPTCIPKGCFGGLSNGPIPLPSWLSEDDIKCYAEKIKQRGLTGPLNYYRALNLNWELTAPWTGVQVKVPAKFIVGDLDITYSFPNAKEYIHNGGFKRDVPLLDEVVVIPGAAHFIQQERADEVTAHILDFFNKF